MKSKKNKTLIALSLLCCSALVSAQEALPATGGNATGNNGSVSYTVGQVAYGTQSGTNGNVIQGVQQPYEIVLINGIDRTDKITLECIAYPNPVHAILKLKTPVGEKSLEYKLYDINGKLLENKKIESSETTILMENYVSSTYILKISDEKKELTTFKIVKK